MHQQASDDLRQRGPSRRRVAFETLKTERAAVVFAQLQQKSKCPSVWPVRCLGHSSTSKLCAAQLQTQQASGGPDRRRSSQAKVCDTQKKSDAEKQGDDTLSTLIAQTYRVDAERRLAVVLSIHKAQNDDPTPNTRTT